MHPSALTHAFQNGSHASSLRMARYWPKGTIIPKENRVDGDEDRRILLGFLWPEAQRDHMSSYLATVSKGSHHCIYLFSYLCIYLDKKRGDKQFSRELPWWKDMGIGFVERDSNWEHYINELKCIIGCYHVTLTWSLCKSHFLWQGKGIV